MLSTTKTQFGLNYGRRIQRPDYADLNPFYYFLDKYTYQVGNPYLKPQFSHNIELSHSYKGMLTTTLSYTAINDIIQQQLEQVDSTHTTYVRQTNLAEQRSVALSVSAGIPITKWWRANAYVQGSYNKYRGYINNGMLDVSGPSLNVNMQNQFTFAKRLEHGVKWLLQQQSHLRDNRWFAARKCRFCSGQKCDEG
jgi:outer membrane receptor for ferrienterochelin and colicin